MQNPTQMETTREMPFAPFEARKAELRSSKDHWKNWFLLNIVFLLTVTVFSAWGMAMGVGFTGILWLTLAAGLPLVYSAIFFHAQHNREREFLEEYSFKSVVARSLEAYHEILKTEVDHKKTEEQKRFLDFMINSVKDLHTPPRAIISKHPIKSEEDVKIGVIEKLADVFKRFIP